MCLSQANFFCTNNLFIRKKFQLLSTPCIGVNINERKSGTERTKKRKKRELVFFPTARGATGTVVHHLDTTRILPRATITRTRHIFIPRPGLSRKQTKLTKCYNFTDRISFANHWKLIDESSEFHLALSRAHTGHSS